MSTWERFEDWVFGGTVLRPLLMVAIFLAVFLTIIQITVEGPKARREQAFTEQCIAKGGVSTKIIVGYGAKGRVYYNMICLKSDTVVE